MTLNLQVKGTLRDKVSLGGQSEVNDLRFQKFQNWVIEEAKIHLYTEFEECRSSGNRIFSRKSYRGYMTSDFKNSKTG